MSLAQAQSLPPNSISRRIIAEFALAAHTLTANNEESIQELIGIYEMMGDRYHLEKAYQLAIKRQASAPAHTAKRARVGSAGTTNASTAASNAIAAKKTTISTRTKVEASNTTATRASKVVSPIEKPAAQSPIYRIWLKIVTQLAQNNVWSSEAWHRMQLPSNDDLDLHGSLLLAQALYRQKDFKAAGLQWVEAINKNQCAMEAHLALINLKKTIDLRITGPHGPILTSFLEAHQAYRAMQYDKTLAILKALPLTTSTQMLKAKTLMNNNQADKAIPCFEWIRKNDPENCEGMNLYADCLTSTGQTDDVYTLANDLLLSTENKPEPYLVLASVWDSGAQKEKALTLYKKALSLDDFHYGTLLALGMHLKREGSFSEAIMYLEQASRLSQDIVMWEAMVECHLELSQTHSASQIARALMDAHSDLPTTLLIAGKVAQHEKQYDLARKLFSRCMGMTQASNSAQALIAYVDLEIATEKYQAAMVLLESKIPFFHTDWLYAKLGELSALMTKWQDAALHFNFALSLNPYNQQAMAGMERLSTYFRPEEADLDEDEYEEEI